MSKIIAWKSDHDGKVFEDKTKYQKHLRKLARERLEKRKLYIKESVADALWNELYETEFATTDDWFKMVIEKQHMFWAEAAKQDDYHWSKVGKSTRGKYVMPVPKLLKFTRSELKWATRVSNTHSAPKGHPQNFMCKDDLPRGYPGWVGRAEWVVEWPKEFDGVYLGSDLFRSGSFDSGRQRAHTGSGGGGSMRYDEEHKCYVQSFGYDFRLYAADWPGMFRVECHKRENKKRQLAWEQLGGVGVVPTIDKLPHDYEYPNPVTGEGW
jgi:hypothetical protein